MATNVVGSRVTDGVVMEPSNASRVAAVFPHMPPIKSYAEAAMDYYVVKPNSTFELAAPDEYVRWRTVWGAAPSSCSLDNTMGRMKSLFNWEDSATWSPSCWDLDCPMPGQPYGSVAAPFKANPRVYRS
jgi:hypothetical protein